MSTDEEFNNDSTRILKSVLLQYAAKLTDEIDVLKRETEDHTRYFGYLKDFLVNSGCLADDILAALQNDKVLLAMIGTRTLLEDAINAHYLQSKEGQNERMAVAADWFRITNDPEAYKNKVDNKTVEQRAVAAGTDTKVLYDGEYAEFCNYTHSTGQRGILNVPNQRSLLAKKATMASIKAYANIVTCITNITETELPKELVGQVQSYLNEYHDTVMVAKLPKLTI